MVEPSHACRARDRTFFTWKLCSRVPGDGCRSSNGGSLTAFFPLKITADWPAALIHATITQLAAHLGFRPEGSTQDLHQNAAEQIIDGFVRDHHISEPEIIECLMQQRSQLIEEYDRYEYRWLKHDDQIILVLAQGNVIPFPNDDIADTGIIIFACGWVDLVMSDRKIEEFKLVDLLHKLPLLFRTE
jgi:hypothetical protein